MKNKWLPAPTIFFLVFLISLNFYRFSQFFQYQTFRSLESVSLSPPGYQLECLRPYLINVRKAGYYTSPYFDPSNLTMCWGFVQAQYALSPTILDVDHPWSFEYLVYISDSGHIDGQLHQQGYKMVFAFHNSIFLFRKSLI